MIKPHIVVMGWRIEYMHAALVDLRMDIHPMKLLPSYLVMFVKVDEDFFL
jgi:hypothetical protein